jgi:NitT/TauT family transport system substrate-binding protein
MRTRRRKRGSAFIALAALLALVLAACGDDGDGDTSASATTAAGGTATTAAGATATTVAAATKVKVTSIGFCNEFYLWWAQEKGIFKANNLDVELVRSTGGAASIAAVMSGAADFGFANGYTTIISYSQGFPIRFVTLAYENAPPGGQPVNAVAVKASGAIKSPTDLVGKRIGVNELAGINQIVTSEWLKKKGVDPKSVNFVALPLAQLAGAVNGGQIDAAQIPITNVPADGSLTTLGDPYSDGPGKVQFAGYVVNKSFFDKNAAAAESFHKAIAESIKQTAVPANQTEKWALAAKNCNQDAARISTQPQNNFVATIDMANLDAMAATLVDQGYIREKPNLADLVPAFAKRA